MGQEQRELTYSQAAEKLGIQAKRIGELVAEGKLTAVEPMNGVPYKAGEPRKWVTAESVEAYKERRTQNAVAPIAVIEQLVASQAGLAGALDMISPERIAQALAIYADRDHCWHRVDEAAKRCGLPAGLLHTLIRTGKLPCMSNNDVRYVRWSDVKGLNAELLSVRESAEDAAGAGA